MEAEMEELLYCISIKQHFFLTSDKDAKRYLATNYPFDPYLLTFHFRRSADK